VKKLLFVLALALFVIACYRTARVLISAFPTERIEGISR
jgi:hypothetical protein